MNNSFLSLSFSSFFFAELWCTVVNFFFSSVLSLSRSSSLALNNSQEKNKRENDLNSTCMRQFLSLSTVLLCIDLQWQTHLFVEQTRVIMIWASRRRRRRRRHYNTSHPSQKKKTRQS